MTRDARLQPATDEQVVRFAAARQIGREKAAAFLERARERQVALAKENPFAFGYEPPIWYVVKALMRNPAWSEAERAHIRRRLGAEWTAEAFAERMRARLGFAHAVTKIQVFGANRAGKTDFSSKLLMQVLLSGPNMKACSGAQTHMTQKKNQMARVWKYMTPELRARNIATKKAKDAVENINYSTKNGFSGSRVTLANGSELDFVTYEQNTTSLEGVEYDLAHLDEEYPKSFYDLMTTRITSRGGTFIGTFTPLNGYTAPIAAFLDGAQVTRYHTAWLRPRDGGAMLPWNELNLTEDEYARLTAWRREGSEGDCVVPESRPEDCFEWLFDGGDGEDLLRLPPGRAFDKVPRVAVCQGGQAAAVWFYGSDNPYALPSELILEKMSDPNAERRIFAQVYGMARDTKGRLVKTFTDASVVAPDEIPSRGVRFMVCDPAPERNWCLGWFVFVPETGTLYKYRDWPGSDEVPGEGVPGPWVVPSDRNDGLNDGARGESQTSFGFGYDRMKFEIARLEGWKSYVDWVAEGNSPFALPEDMGFVEEWDPCDGARERMAFRLLDSRAASQSKISRGTNQTLLADLDALMPGWEVADGQRCEVGYQKLIDLFAKQKYRVSSDCVNTITCYKLLTGKDGQKGAAKDFIDLDRYAVLSDIWSYRADQAAEIGAPEAAVGAGRVDGGRLRGRGARVLPTGFRGENRRVWW